jgi:predicted ATPase
MAPLKLHRIRIAGFRSLGDVGLELSPITVVIGPNGSGKSNLLSALQMIAKMRTRSLRLFVGERGGASALLHYGPKTTHQLTTVLSFGQEVEGETCVYIADLGPTAGDSLYYINERVECFLHGIASSAHLGVGHSESKLEETASSSKAPPAMRANDLIAGMKFFHFHDTSPNSPLRQSSRVADSRELQSDGSNLASFLYALKTNEHEDSRPSWNLINGLVRRVAPFIKELVPDLVSPHRPEQSAVRLYWKDERDHLFDVSDLSDGTLRAIALFTALGQPAYRCPSFITIDEPELGLHPAAVGIFAALVRSVSQHCQILLATQSPALLDEFEPEDVVVTERSNGETTFRRLDSAHLAAWLDDYSLSDLYDKNVLGGRP